MLLEPGKFRLNAPNDTMSICNWLRYERERQSVLGGEPQQVRPIRSCNRKFLDCAVTAQPEFRDFFDGWEGK